VQQLNSAKQN